MSNEEIMRRKMAEIAGRYLARTVAEITDLQNLVVQLPVGEKVTLKELELLAHRIRGSGAVFGFAKISDVAGEIEMLAVHSAAEESPNIANLVQLFTAHVQTLGAETQLAVASQKG